jgi:hypothetical protein
MKYYETSYDEYLTSVGLYNLHPELLPIYNSLPKQVMNFENIIMYGAAGVGKYSQCLSLLKRYSNSELKYDKKLTVQTDKSQYTFRISDVHYEIDMSLLGCNSKTLWHDIFLQIVDIVSVKSEKVGIIVCKNFSKVSTDILEIFYSYMQQYNTNAYAIRIKYIILTESISFIPSKIVNACNVIRVQRPSAEKYLELINYTQHMQSIGSNPHDFINRINDAVKPTENTRVAMRGNSANVVRNINCNGVLNLKEMRSFSLLSSPNELPDDVFNLICDNIIREIENINNAALTNFRDILYDMLTYNLEVHDCLWYIIKYFIETGKLSNVDVSDILTKTYSFLKYYNNNYRPIYHLESMMLYITIKVHKFNEL